MTPPQEEYCLIPLTQGQSAKVSPHRFEEINSFKWFAYWNNETRSFYAGRTPRIQGKQIFVPMHRFIMGVTSGDSRQIDHVDHDTLNNTDKNLRIVTPSQNKMNSGKYRSNPSGYKGVHFHKRWPKRVFVSIRVNKKLRHIATFPNTHEGILEAAKCYDRTAHDIFGEYAHLNFPNEFVSHLDAPR